MRALFTVVAAIGLLPAGLVGQIPGTVGDEFDQDYWYDVFYPKLLYSTRDGLVFGGYVGFHQPVRFEDFDLPQPYRASISVNAQASTTGSRFIVFSGRLPQFVEGWRFVGTAGVRRDARDNFFGIGNRTTYDADSVTDANPNFYRARQTRWFLRLESQRYLVESLRVLFGIDAQRWRYQPLDGASVFANSIAVGTNTTIRTDFVTDVSFRGGFVFDTRNDEIFPERGVHVQLIGAVADPDILGQSLYSRLLFSAAGHYPVSERLNIAGRFLAQGMGGSPGLGAMYVIDGQEDFALGFGGAGSHRAIRDNRLIGRHKLLTNLDVRYSVFAIPTLVRITAVGFIDAGRVFEGEAFQITTDDLKVGGGTGVFAQIGRSGVIGMTTGIGPDGVAFFLHTKWPF